MGGGGRGGIGGVQWGGGRGSKVSPEGQHPNLLGRPPRHRKTKLQVRTSGRRFGRTILFTPFCVLC